MIIATVRLAGDHTQAELAKTLRTLEHRLMSYRYVGLALLTLATPGECRGFSLPTSFATSPPQSLETSRSA
jgi:hypothetical protein